jgi:uncharacterized protein (UPF0335 family)
MSITVAAEQIRSLVGRIERIEEEIKALNAGKSDIYKEAKGQGFDVKALRQCVSARRMDSSEYEERTALFELYWSALHGPSRVHVHVRENTQSQPARGESYAKSADVSECDPYLIDGRRQDDIDEQDRSQPKQVRSGRTIAVSPAPRNGDGSEPAGQEAPTESAAQISATHSPSSVTSSQPTTPAGAVPPPGIPAGNPSIAQRKQREVA